MKIDWTETDDDQALSEGWAIVAVDHENHPPLELQAWFDAGVFVDGNSANDQAAVAFVVEKAENGSPLHLRALLHIEQNAPTEANHWKDQGLWPLWTAAVLAVIDQPVGAA